MLLKELQSLALDVTVLDEEGNEVKMTEDIDYGDGEVLSYVDEGNDYRNEGFSGLGNGFSEVDPESGDLTDSEYEDNNDDWDDSEFEGDEQ